MKQIEEGTVASFVVNVIEEGVHKSATIDTTTTRLSTHPAAAPVVTTLSTGVYRVKFTGLSPALSISDNADTVTLAVNGDINGTSWSEYHISVKIVAPERGTDNASTFDHTTDDVNTNAASRTASQADVSALATQASVDTVDSNVDAVLLDTNELQTNQGNWLTATGFSTHSAADVVTALQAVANDFKADISALASQASVDTIDSIVDAIKAKTDQLAFTVAGQVDANALTGGGGATAAEVYSEFTSGANADAFKADVSGLSTFDHTTDQVVASNMRGTDGANTVAPDNASITAILADTNELQLNQGDWVTATGFSTHSSSDVVSGLQAVSGDFKADVSSLLTTAAYSGSLPANFSTLLIGTGADTGKVTTSNPAAGSGSSHTAADVAALILATPANKLVTNATGQVEASNMRGTDGANTVAPVDVSANVAAILADTNELQQNQNNWLTATGFSTHDAAAVVTAMQVVADDFKADVSNLSTDAPSAADIYTYFTDGTRENVFKADVSGLNDITAADVYSYFVDGSREEAFKANIAGLSTLTAADVYTYFTAGSREDLFKADVSGLNTVTPPTAQQIYDLFVSGSNEDAFKADVSNITADAPTAQEIYDLFTSGSNEDAFKADVSGLGGGGGSVGLTVQDIVDGVWDEAYASHTDAGSFGEAIGGFTSGTGIGNGIHAVTVLVRDGSLAAVPNARVSVDGTTLELVTNSSGTVTFMLDSGVYTLRCAPPEGYDSPADNVITVTTSDLNSTFTINQTSVPSSPSSVPWIG